jgi:hypothetical protein
VTRFAEVGQYVAGNVIARTLNFNVVCVCREPCCVRCAGAANEKRFAA